MKTLISKLIIFGRNKESEILLNLADIVESWKNSDSSKADIIKGIYEQTSKLLILATDYGFNDNLWHNYLTYIMITDENPFSITCEKSGAGDGSVNYFAKNDFDVFKKLFDYDFSEIENDLGIDCFDRIQNYKSIPKSELMYNKNVSEKVVKLSRELENAKDAQGFFDLVTGFYDHYGVGLIGLNKAFRINVAGDKPQLVAINNMDKVMLDDLIGYEIQKKKLTDNTESFVEGRGANNCLLFGDSGTGKSTSIKAIVNEYYDRGLRMIELYKYQMKYLSEIIAYVKNRNYKFIIYMDDLSFEEFEVEYKFLKAVIEGGVETRPDNVLIYATSNRRHLIKETWSDRNDVEVDNGMHRSDTMEEKLSLVYRFGVTINYSKPTQKEYFDMAVKLCRRLGVKDEESVIIAEANKWELSHGGISGRTAQQFATYMAGRRV